MGTILIDNPLLVAIMNNAQREFTGGHILIEDGLIKSIGSEPLDIEADELIDATGMVVLPGFVNTHHHLYQTLTRNVRRMQNAGLFEWIKSYYELWRELTEEAVYISALSGLLELMKSGATTSSDHLYLFPARESGHLVDAEIRAARELGIRFHPSRGSMSLGRSKGGLPPDDLVQSEEEIQLDTDRLVDRYHDPFPGAMIRLTLAPCSPFSVTPELMKATVDYAREHDLRLHTHLAETLDEEKYCLKTYGCRPANLVESLGWFTDRSWFAHAIHLTNEEIQRMGTARVGISHCPSSNMRLGSGIARIREMLEAGVGVSLGVDGAASNDSSNMLMEIRNALLLSRLRDRPYWLSAREVLWMATRGGAQVLGRDDIGELVPGKRADIALFSTQGIEYAGAQTDPLAALVFTVRQSPVDYLIVEGNVSIRQGRSTVDEVSLIKQHNTLAEEILKSAGEHSGINFLEESGHDAKVLSD